jgi:hypothetical protein
MHNTQCTLCTPHSAHCTVLYCTVHTLNYTVQYRCSSVTALMQLPWPDWSQLASHLVSPLVPGDHTPPGLPHRSRGTTGSTRPMSLVPRPTSHIPDDLRSRSHDPKSQPWDWGPASSVAQSLAVWHKFWQFGTKSCSVAQSLAVWHIVWQCGT